MADGQEQGVTCMLSLPLSIITRLIVTLFLLKPAYGTDKETSGGAGLLSGEVDEHVALGAYPVNHFGEQSLLEGRSISLVITDYARSDTR